MKEQSAQYWYSLSKCIAIDEIYKNPNLPWDRGGLSQNIGITVNLIKNIRLPNAKGEWDWNSISQHIAISEVLAHPNEPWNRWGLSFNPETTMEFMRTVKLPNAKHNWSFVHRTIISKM